MKDKSIVIDANIIVRAVLGTKVAGLLKKNFEHIRFYTPEVCLHDAIRHIPGICQKRNISEQISFEMLDKLKPFITPVESYLYKPYEKDALARIEMRDADDWPIIACAMLHQCPIWTEDNDFFGSGIASWTTDRVHIYLLPQPLSGS